MNTQSRMLKERRGSWYNPWIVDEFLRILDTLERLDAEDAHDSISEASLTRSNPKELDFIAATTAEERVFNELRRELPLAKSFKAAGDVLFRHVLRVVPVACVTLFTPNADASEVTVAVCGGLSIPALEDLRVVVGERISGWAFAHRQVVMNSNAALELGPVVRTFAAYRCGMRSQSPC